MQELLDDLNEVPNLAVITAAEAEPSSIDAVIHVSISENRMEAYLRVDPPLNGGAPPTLKGFEDALAARKITYGINTSKMKGLAANPVYDTDHLIAQGVMPVNGINGTYRFQFSMEKDYRPKEKADGTVDYRDLGVVESVKKGQLLCIITPPTDGSEGTALTGIRLKQIKGKAVPPLAGKNTELSADGTGIFSTIDGQVEFDGRKIHVSETLFLKGNVDNSTGDIKFIGNVIIEGTVLDNFVVEAGGNIEIGGTVGSVILKAEGNILLRSGIIGGDINCKGDLTSKFIEHCNVLAMGNITADYIMTSNIKCGDSITLTGSKGKIAGGSCVAGRDITARIIGTLSGLETDLKIGMDPAIVARQQELIKQLPGLEKQIVSLKSLISLLKEYEAANRLTPDKKVMLDNANSSHLKCIGLFASNKQELSAINEKLQSVGEGKITCSGTIFPGTRITIGSAKVLVTDALQSTTLYYSDGSICQSRLRQGY